MGKNIFTKILSMLTMMTLGINYLVINNTFAENNIESSVFVSPMSQEISLIPGESFEGTISVSNAANAQGNLKYKIAVGSYGIKKGDGDIDDYSGGVDVETRTSHNEIMSWITIDSDHGSVEPNGTDKVNFQINVPENAPAGAQYATILVVKDDDSREKNNSTDAITMQNTYQLASRIIANVAGENIEKGAVTENNIPSFLTTGPLEATSMVRNDGNIYTDAEYTLQVWPLFSNEEICTNEEEAETSLVLPETERYHAQSCNLPTVGIFRAKQTVKIFGEESIIEKTIIVCPIWLLFIIIFVIFALIFYFIAKAKTRKKASQKTSRS